MPQLSPGCSDWVGGRVAPPVLPHHRTYGSVYGGSRGPLHGPKLIEEAPAAPFRKHPIVNGRVHMRGSSVPPGPQARCRGLARTCRLKSPCKQFPTAGLGFTPLLPQDFAQASAHPLIQGVTLLLHLRQSKVANPSTRAYSTPNRFMAAFGDSRKRDNSCSVWPPRPGGRVLGASESLPRVHGRQAS